MSVLSIQTWQIHALSIFEWVVAIELVWIYANSLKAKFFLKLAAFMISFIISGTCIITWHYYSNLYTLIWLVIFQAFLTFFANFCLSRIYR